MQLNKMYSVKTIDRVAAELGETVDRIFDLAVDMETEDGVICVYSPGDDSVIAFTLRCDRVWGSPGYPFDEAERADLIGRAFDRCWTPEGVRRQFAAVRSSGSRVDLLKTITVPRLVIHGLDDCLAQSEHGRDTARNIPGAALVEIPGMGHDLEGDLGPMIANHVMRHARHAEAPTG